MLLAETVLTVLALVAFFESVISDRYDHIAQLVTAFLVLANIVLKVVSDYFAKRREEKKERIEAEKADRDTAEREHIARQVEENKKEISAKVDENRDAQIRNTKEAAAEIKTQLAEAATVVAGKVDAKHDEVKEVLHKVEASTNGELSKMKARIAELESENAKLQPHTRRASDPTIA